MAVDFSFFDKNEYTWRKAWSETALAVARADKRAVFMQADLGRCYDWQKCAEEFPDRVFNTGISEQNGISACAGMATMGKIPFFSTFTPFATFRALEQIRVDCAYPCYPVRIVGSDPGLSLTNLGSTHLGLDDIAAVLAIPEVIVISPSDPVVLGKLTEKLMNEKKPAYIRIGGGEKARRIYSSDNEFEIGKAVTLRKGNDCAVITHGTITPNVIDACDILREQGIEATLIDMSTIRPIDKEAVINAAKETGLVFTVEEHVLNGALGSQVAAVMAESGTGRLVRLGLPDKFICEVSSYEVMLKDYGLDPEGIAKNIAKEIKK